MPIIIVDDKELYLCNTNNYPFLWKLTITIKQDVVRTGIKTEGSNLSGVCVTCFWEESYVNNSVSQPAGFPLGSTQDAHSRKDLGTRFHVLPPIPGSSLMPKRELGDGTLPGRMSACSSVVSERTRTLRGVHLRFGFEAAMLLPLALR